MGSSKIFNASGSVTVALSNRKVRPSGGGMQLPLGQPVFVGFSWAVGVVALVVVFEDEMPVPLELPNDELPLEERPLPEALEPSKSMSISRGG